MNVVRRMTTTLATATSASSKSDSALLGRHSTSLPGLLGVQKIEEILSDDEPSSQARSNAKASTPLSTHKTDSSSASLAKAAPRSDESLGLKANASNDQGDSSKTPQPLVKHTAGKAVWAKVNGHPWWPCKIICEVSSDGSSFFKMIEDKPAYYVEFFACPDEHAWVKQSSLFSYKGIEAFKTYAQAQVDRASSKAAKERLAERFQLKVATNRRQQWENAIKLADQAISPQEKQVSIKQEHPISVKSPPKTPVKSPEIPEPNTKNQAKPAATTVKRNETKPVNSTSKTLKAVNSQNVSNKGPAHTGKPRSTSCHEAPSTGHKRKSETSVDETGISSKRVNPDTTSLSVIKTESFQMKTVVQSSTPNQVKSTNFSVAAGLTNTNKSSANQETKENFNTIQKSYTNNVASNQTQSTMEANTNKFKSPTSNSDSARSKTKTKKLVDSNNNETMNSFQSNGGLGINSLEDAIDVYRTPFMGTSAAIEANGFSRYNNFNSCIEKANHYNEDDEEEEMMEVQAASLHQIGSHIGENIDEDDESEEDEDEEEEESDDDSSFKKEPTLIYDYDREKTCNNTSGGLNSLLPMTTNSSAIPSQPSYQVKSESKIPVFESTSHVSGTSQKLQYSSQAFSSHVETNMIAPGKIMVDDIDEDEEDEDNDDVNDEDWVLSNKRLNNSRKLSASSKLKMSNALPQSQSASQPGKLYVSNEQQVPVKNSDSKSQSYQSAQVNPGQINNSGVGNHSLWPAIGSQENTGLKKKRGRKPKLSIVQNQNQYAAPPVVPTQLGAYEADNDSLRQQHVSRNLETDFQKAKTVNQNYLAYADSGCKPHGFSSNERPPAFPATSVKKKPLPSMADQVLNKSLQGQIVAQEVKHPPAANMSNANNQKATQLKTVKRPDNSTGLNHRILSQQFSIESTSIKKLIKKSPMTFDAKPFDASSSCQAANMNFVRNGTSINLSSSSSITSSSSPMSSHEDEEDSSNLSYSDIEKINPKKQLKRKHFANMSSLLGTGAPMSFNDDNDILASVINDVVNDVTSGKKTGLSRPHSKKSSTKSSSSSSSSSLLNCKPGSSASSNSDSGDPINFSLDDMGSDISSRSQESSCKFGRESSVMGGSPTGSGGNSTAETYLIDRYKYAVRHIRQGLSVEEACNKYRISKGALLKCLSGGTAPRGKKTRLTETEENEIVEWLISNNHLKYNEAIHMVFQQVINIFKQAQRPNPFNNGKPSMDWWYDFLSRHPQIMASKPDWLMRGKVNDQYIKDVQSGQLKCTKFRRALLSAIQYIRSLNDGGSSAAVAASAAATAAAGNSPPPSSESANTTPSSFSSSKLAKSLSAPSNTSQHKMTIPRRPGSPSSSHPLSYADGMRPAISFKGSSESVCSRPFPSSFPQPKFNKQSLTPSPTSASIQTNHTARLIKTPPSTSFSSPSSSSASSSLTSTFLAVANNMNKAPTSVNAKRRSTMNSISSALPPPNSFQQSACHQQSSVAEENPTIKKLVSSNINFDEFRKRQHESSVQPAYMQVLASSNIQRSEQPMCSKLPSPPQHSAGWGEFKEDADDQSDSYIVSTIADVVAAATAEANMSLNHHRGGLLGDSLSSYLP